MEKPQTQDLKGKCQMVVAECVGGSRVSNAEVVVVVDDEATVPNYPKHLRRLNSPLKQPQMLYGSKWVRLRKARVVVRMIWWMA